MKDSVNIYNKSGREAAGRRFEKAVARVIPGLQNLTQYIPISWWTSEHVLVSDDLQRMLLEFYVPCCCERCTYLAEAQ